MRRVGRVVDGTGLENRHTGNRIGGSNPSLSARFLQENFWNGLGKKKSYRHTLIFRVISDSVQRSPSQTLFGLCVQVVRDDLLHSFANPNGQHVLRDALSSV